MILPMQSQAPSHAIIERRRQQRIAEQPQPATSPPPSFRGANAAAQRIIAPEWILSGPSETGKTWATLYRLDTLMRTTPNAQGALVRKLRSTMDGTVLVTWRRVIAMSGSGAVPFGGEKPQWYDYPNGARLWVGGMDSPEKILSGERDFVYVNQAEELTQDDWETLTTRTTGRGAVTATPMLFGDCNPGGAEHWILRREQAGALTRLVSRHEDNPTLFDDDGRITPQGERTIRTLDQLSGSRYLRLRKGLWVGAEGQFFTTWDEALHVCDPFPIPQDWRIWGALDYGFTHPTVFHLFAEHHGTVYVIGEHAAHRWLVPQHADAIRALVLRVAPWAVVGDRLDMRIVAGHDVFQQKGDRQGATIAEQYAEHGIRLRHASIDRITGAQRIMERLGNLTVNLAPSVAVFRTCSRLIATLPSMEVDPNRDEDVRKVDADAEGRGGDDAYDAFRYGLMEANRPAVAVPATPRVQNRWSTLR